MRALLLALCLVVALPVLAQDTLNFEAEDVCTPPDAWVKDKLVPGKWNLWSTDSDAAKNEYIEKIMKRSIIKTTVDVKASDRLLTAAREVFRSDAASLEAVARRAGLGIATLYRHFPTREALFQAVYAR